VKRSILYFSDCPFFAGCENMLVNFFHSPEIRQAYEISFIYRWSHVYETGLRNRIVGDILTTPVRLHDHFELYQKIDRISPECIRKPLKILALIFMKYPFLLANTYILFRTIRNRHIDLVHINSGGYPGAYSSYAMLFAARLCGIRKTVFVVNNIAAGYTFPERWPDYCIDQFLVHKLPVLFVTGSRCAGEQLKEILKLSGSSVISIHNGISPRAVTETRQEVVRRLNLPEERVTIAIVAVLEERKGHIFLLKALGELKRKSPGDPLPFCIIEGTGSKEESLKRYVRENNLSSDVRFIAHEENIFNLIFASDCIVLPSVSNEDFPNIILEAMSLGKPVIASRFSGIPEQVEDGISGILVEPRDVSGLADAIQRIVVDPALRRNLGNNAQKRFQELFTDKKAIECYHRLYTHILEDA